MPGAGLQLKTTMKTFKAILTVAALTAALATAALAQPATYSSFSAGTTNGATALSWVVIGANSANSGTPIVTMIDAVSDKAGAKVQAYRITSETPATHTNSTVTLPVASGGVNSGTILIRHLLSDTYEKRTLTTSTASTNLVVTAAPLANVVPGDVIYHISSTFAPSITLKTNNFTIGGTGNSLQMEGTQLIAGQKGKPLLLEVDGTSSATLQGATAKYE